MYFPELNTFFLAKEKIWLNDYLEIYKIPYIASSKSALDNESDKNKAKKIIRLAKIKTADFFTAYPNEHLDTKSIPVSFPLFIKPIIGGDSRGIDSNSIVNTFDSFKKKVLEIKKNHNLTSIAESYLTGREYSVGILEDSISGILRALPVEIIVKKNINGHSILDFNIKKNDEEKVIAVKDVKNF